MQKGDFAVIWWVIMIEMLVFAALFTIIVLSYYRGDRKYSPESIHNYPPDIQEAYSKHMSASTSPTARKACC